MTMRGRNLLWPLGLIPCAAAFVAEAITVQATPLPDPPLPPALAFVQYGASFGEIGPYPMVEAHYTFQNIGPRSVSIDDVSPSCGCLRWQLYGDKRSYQPGERGRLTLRLFTANEPPGPHRYSLDVTWTDGRQHSDHLLFRVTLPERKVSVEPHEVFFYQLHGQPEERTIYVTDFRGKGGEPLRVKGASCTSSSVQVEVLPAEADERGRPRTPIRLSVPANVPPGRQIAQLRIATGDADFPLIGVPVLIQGRQPVEGPPPPEGGRFDLGTLLRTPAQIP